MFDIARQLHFTRSLERFSIRLDELLKSALGHQSPHSTLPAELLDELALTTGELMLVLTNHPSHQEDELLREVIAHARSLRARLRAQPSEAEPVTTACESFRQEIAQLVRDSKRAA